MKLFTKVALIITYTILVVIGVGFFGSFKQTTIPNQDSRTIIIPIGWVQNDTKSGEYACAVRATIYTGIPFAYKRHSCGSGGNNTLAFILDIFTAIGLATWLSGIFLLVASRLKKH